VAVDDPAAAWGSRDYRYIMSERARQRRGFSSEVWRDSQDREQLDIPLRAAPA
jgi:hypothetical protein